MGDFARQTERVHEVAKQEKMDVGESLSKRCIICGYRIDQTGQLWIAGFNDLLIHIYQITPY